MKSIKPIITLVVGIILLGLLIYINDPEELFKVIKKSNIYLLLLSTSFLISMHIIMAIRAKYFATLLNEKLSFSTAFNAHMLGMLLSEFTPGRSGYFISSAYLRKKGMESGKALTILVAGQPFDFASKFIGASLGFFLIMQLDGRLLLIPFIIVISFFLLVFCKRFTKLLEKIGNKTVFGIPYVGKALSKLLLYLKSMNEHSRIILKKIHVIIAFIILSYTSRIINWYLLFLAIGGLLSNSVIHDFLTFYLLQPLINIVEFIPLPTPAGSGFSESASILVLGKFGIESTKALAFALLARVQTVIVSFIFGYLPMKETAAFIKDKIF